MSIFFDMLFWEIIVPHIYSKELPGLSSYFGEVAYEHGKVRIEKDDVVFDLGANVGFFSAYASHSGASVFAFEPSQYNLNYLKKTAELNPSITVCPYAVSDKMQELEFFVVEANIGATRDIKLFDDSWGEEKGIKEIVQATSLDEYVASNSINKLDFIKADIEGAERDMLKGAKDTLLRFSPKLSICTYHLHDDKEVLPRLILEAQPKYKIAHVGNKLFAYA